MSEPRLTGYHIAVDDSDSPRLETERPIPVQPSHARYARVTDTGSHRVENPSDLLSLFEETYAPQDFSDTSQQEAYLPEMSTTEVKALSSQDIKALNSQVDATPVMDEWRSGDEVEVIDVNEIHGETHDPEVSLERFARRARSLALLSVLCMVYLTYDALTTLDPFQVREVSFQGASYVSDDELRGLLNLDELRPSYINPQLDQIKRAVEAHSWIKSAHASMDWGSGVISIAVSEYQPQGVITLKDLRAVTAEGVPFATVQPQDLKGLPLISGVPPAMFQGSPHDKLIGQYWISSAIELSRYIQSSEILKSRALSDIHISETGQFEVMLDQIRVVLGADLLRERILELERILEHLDHKGVSAAYILLSDDLKRAIVKEVPLQATSARFP